METQIKIENKKKNTVQIRIKIQIWIEIRISLRCLLFSEIWLLIGKSEDAISL